MIPGDIAHMLVNDSHVKLWDARMFVKMAVMDFCPAYWDNTTAGRWRTE